MIKDVEQLTATSSELEIYLLVDTCGAFIWRMNHTRSRGHISDDEWSGVAKDVEGARRDQVKLLSALPRFGLDRPLDEDGRPTAEYWLWYRWWDAWKKGLTDDEWRRLDAAMSRGMTPEEAVRWRPEGSWQPVIESEQPQ